MSMNLCFLTKTKRKHRVEFPYQTSTNITYAVLRANTNEEKFKILKDDMESFGAEQYLIDEVYKMINDDELELIMVWNKRSSRSKLLNSYHYLQRETC